MLRLKLNGFILLHVSSDVTRDASQFRCLTLLVVFDVCKGFTVPDLTRFGQSNPKTNSVGGGLLVDGSVSLRMHPLQVFRQNDAA